MPDAAFLIDRFTVFGFQFQNWMIVAAAALVLSALIPWFRNR